MMQKEKMYRYAGDLSQLFYAKQYRFSGGRADGMRGIDVNNGAGIEFTLFPDRALDIGRFAVDGDNCAFLAKSGLAAPAYCDNKGAGWLTAYQGGLLTTCGLTQVGAPCVSDGEELGLHGSINAAPTEELCCRVDMESEIPEIRISGKMRMADSLGPRRLVLNREYKIKYGDDKLYIKDRVHNAGVSATPYMVLYHMNMGYPLLDEGAEFSTSAEYVASAGDYEQAVVEARFAFPAPEDNAEEGVFYYDAVAGADSLNYAQIYNGRLGKGLKIWSDPEQLKSLTQWKLPQAGSYVMGIEPCNCRTKGREEQKKYGLEYIKPGETRTQDIIIEVLR